MTLDGPQRSSGLKEGGMDCDDHVGEVLMAHVAGEVRHLAYEQMTHLLEGSS